MDERVREMQRILDQEKYKRDDASKKLMKKIFKMLKEEQKKIRQDGYEQKLQAAVEELTELVSETEQRDIKKKVEKIVHEVERIAYKEGYAYASEELEEGLENMVVE